MRRGYKKRTGIGVIALVVLVMCGIVTYKRVDLDAKSAKKENVVVDLKSQLEEEEERTIEIQNLKKHVNSKEYIEEIARENFGLVYEDEILFQPEDSEE